MKTKHLKSTLALVTATLALVFFNNFTAFDLAKPETPSLEGINEASRVAHAKELLGKRYKGSNVQKTEGRKSMNYVIYKKVKEQLSAQWKGHARSIARTVIKESAKYDLDPVFILAVIETESKFNPITVGSFGEIGLMQVKPDTAEWIAKKYSIPWKGNKTLRNPEANIRIGVAYMNYLRQQFPGKARKYVSAYNMGPRNVRRLLAQNIVPAEYNSRVMKNYADFYSTIVTPAKATTVAAN